MAKPRSRDGAQTYSGGSCLKWEVGVGWGGHLEWLWQLQLQPGTHRRRYTDPLSESWPVVLALFVWTWRRHGFWPHFAPLFFFFFFVSVAAAAAFVSLWRRDKPPQWMWQKMCEVCMKWKIKFGLGKGTWGGRVVTLSHIHAPSMKMELSTEWKKWKQLKSKRCKESVFNVKKSRHDFSQKVDQHKGSVWIDSGCFQVSLKSKSANKKWKSDSGRVKLAKFGHGWWKWMWLN